VSSSVLTQRQDKEATETQKNNYETRSLLKLKLTKGNLIGPGVIGLPFV
jgi:hypothetical protein